ncbi:MULTISPECIES: tRNA1(Val) (adenine(37)-N6)-methyltransferase [Flavobacteriaceae]|uniref:tRNA1(Val) (adenine(37)-N6)-methyltransferase n=2 Tax=Flavobacteriaceae TaxID=49546 RepID=A0A4Y8AQH7_9FLAO|nr:MULTISPECIES: methyltransferase [Flavobacteriaceae]TEW73012.1 methyltransferase domain-containing protein [Gramella jeungdoensis]GGK47800.1 tRNA1(Val) (adenine(37)-N6)-methyltransferase [Lutibacter litoralis]
MSNKPFQFKQFTIQQDKTAMKVGTDGVLLGAWVSLGSNPFSILDIGAGTGLIALMLAQKSSAELIDAVELNNEAYEQTVANFEESDWGDRLFCYHASLQEFAEEIEDTYDLIVSNPPFYTSTYKNLEENRAMARHTETLTYRDLLQGVSKLLSENGSCAFIIPYTEASNFIEIAAEFRLFPNRITNVKGIETSEIKRSLLQFSFKENKIEETMLIIEIERHNYTTAYKNLVKDFYLKM